MPSPCCHEVHQEEENERHDELIQEADQWVEGGRAGHPDTLKVRTERSNRHSLEWSQGPSAYQGTVPAEKYGTAVTLL